MNVRSVDWHLIYSALIYSIRSNTGDGFHNGDQGHVAYWHGADTGKGGHGDDPESNTLFQTLREICANYRLPDELPKVTTWKDFCQLAVESYKQHRLA